MPPDELIVRNTRQCLAYARDDFRLAGNAADQATSPFLKDAVSHSQQVAEKALKAFLTWHDIPFPRIHDLKNIGSCCVAKDASLQGPVDRKTEGDRSGRLLTFIPVLEFPFAQVHGAGESSLILWQTERLPWPVKA